MFTPKHIKDAKHLAKAVKKFLRYKEDIISEEKHEELTKMNEEFIELVKQKPSKDEVKKASKKLTKACESSVPKVSNPGIRENVEVIFVAIVIAMGIRAFFLQPFKIPTGSMEPTLNGINPPAATVNVEDVGILKQAWDLVMRGRNYVHFVAEEDIEIESMEQDTFAKFFTYTKFRLANGDVRRVWAPQNKLDGLGFTGMRPYRKGEVIVSGYIDAGDQVLVDKFSYHFRRPSRGEVFVFQTTKIRGIEEKRDFNPEWGAQHYIKRLAGLPNDRLDISNSKLYVNGKIPEELGFQRVMSMKDGYHGYIGEYKDIEIPDNRYFALGDNSRNSSDSRVWNAQLPYSMRTSPESWDTVPEPNLVGPALVVYWPFIPHFGFIR